METPKFFWGISAFSLLAVGSAFSWLAAASAFKFFAGGIAGIYRFHRGSIGGNSNFLGGAGLCVVVFTFFHMTDQIFHKSAPPFLL